MIDAADEVTVAARLRADGITPTKITVKPSSAADLDLGALLSGGRVGIDELIMFCRQMYSLSKAGVPIISALQGLTESARSAVLQETLQMTLNDIGKGLDLASSFERRPKVFSPLFVALIRVGENTGRLDQSFQQLGLYLERERETAKTVKQATRYPVTVVAAIAIAIIVINVFVIPAFASVFASLRAELPWATKILLATSDFFVNWWWVMLLIAFGAALAIRNALRTESGRTVWDRLKLRMPLGGDILFQATLSRFTRSFSLMTRAGVPILTILDVCADAVGNLHVGEKVREMRNGVEGGEALSRVARKTEMFSPLVLQMLAVGEETGSVDDLLEEVADYYDEEVDYALKRLSDAIEPILIVAMGALVMILALGVFLPLWDLGAAARGS